MNTTKPGQSAMLVQVHHFSTIAMSVLVCRERQCMIDAYRAPQSTALQVARDRAETMVVHKFICSNLSFKIFIKFRQNLKIT
jgi:hypothetical protein